MNKLLILISILLFISCKSAGNPFYGGGSVCCDYGEITFDSSYFSFDSSYFYYGPNLDPDPQPICNPYTGESWDGIIPSNPIVSGRWVEEVISCNNNTCFFKNYNRVTLIFESNSCKFTNYIKNNQNIQIVKNGYYNYDDEFLTLLYHDLDTLIWNIHYKSDDSIQFKFNELNDSCIHTFIK